MLELDMSSLENGLEDSAGGTEVGRDVVVTECVVNMLSGKVVESGVSEAWGLSEVLVAEFGRSGVWSRPVAVGLFVLVPGLVKSSVRWSLPVLIEGGRRLPDIPTPMGSSVIGRSVSTGMLTAKGTRALDVASGDVGYRISASEGDAFTTAFAGKQDAAPVD